MTQANCIIIETMTIVTVCWSKNDNHNEDLTHYHDHDHVKVKVS